MEQKSLHTLPLFVVDIRYNRVLRVGLRMPEIKLMFSNITVKHSIIFNGSLHLIIARSPALT